MNPELFGRASAALDRLLDCDESSRSAQLDELSSNDPVLGALVARLLEGAERTDGVIDRPVMESFTREASSEDISDALLADDLDPAGLPFGDLHSDEDEGFEVPERIGAYRLCERIGRGGMGIVHRAERDDGQFAQEVAVKLLRPGSHGRAVVTRFRRESRILARLEHANIARLIDAGIDESSGRSTTFLVMEFVRGEPITQWCDRRNLEIEARLDIFKKVCRAVQFAHQKLIVHRDLKPSNILVSETGEPKLLDFGIAKPLLQRTPEQSTAQTGETALTVEGRAPLTPDYAAPEQVSGEEISTATDVYGLGVVLCELLCGDRPPRVCQAEAPLPRPSVLLRQMSPEQARASAAHRGTSGSRLIARLRGDLDTIVSKALRYEPRDRYSSVEALLADIERHLERQPLLAEREPRLTRVRKFLSRHRVAVATAMLVLSSLLIGLFAALQQARLARLEAAKADRVRDFVVGLFESSDPARTRGLDLTARELLERGEQELETSLVDEPIVQSEILLTLGRVFTELGETHRALPLVERARALRQQALGNRDVETADALQLEGDILERLGRTEEAIPVLERALAVHRKNRQPHALAEDLDLLAIAQRSSGHMDEALARAEESLRIRQAAFPEAGLEIAESLNNMGVLARETGRYDEAEAYYRQVIEIREPLLGRDHPQTIFSLGNLGALLLYQGREEEGVRLLEEVVTLDLRVYGEDHPETVRNRNNLAWGQMRAGRFEAANEIFSRLLEYWLRVEDETHPNALATLNNLAVCDIYSGHFERAAEEVERFLAAVEENLPNDHPFWVNGWANEAAIERARGEPEKALSLLDRAIALRSEKVGPENPEVARLLLAHAASARDRGDTSVAQRDLRKAFEIRRAGLGEEQVETVAAMMILGVELRDEGHWEEAGPLLESALAFFEARKGKLGPHRAASLLELGRLELERGELAKARELLGSAAESHRAVFGPTSWQTARAELWLARADGRAGVPSGGERERAALERLREILGPRHPLVNGSGGGLVLTVP